MTYAWIYCAQGLRILRLLSSLHSMFLPSTGGRIYKDVYIYEFVYLRNGISPRRVPGFVVSVPI